MMPGGSEESWKTLKPIFESIAAKAEGEPCVTHIGLNGAGHFVKMVHNGIEYSDMQLIAESYDLMRRGLGMTPAEIGDVFEEVEQDRTRLLSDRNHRRSAASGRQEDR